MARLLVSVILIALSLHALGQNNFRTRQSGSWNQSATWEEFIAGSWQITVNTPSSASGTITILNGHQVDVTANVTIDQTTVQGTGTINVSDGIVLTLANALGHDLNVSGNLILNGESFLTGAGNLLMNGDLTVGSLNATGAIITGTTAGNIRVNNRTFGASSRVIYAGAGPQFIGNGHPGTSSTGAVTEIANASGVTFNTTTTGNSGVGRLTIPGLLILTSGNLNIVSTATGRALYLSANVTENANFITVSGPTTDIFIAGGGSFGTFPFQAGAQTIRSLSFERTGSSLTFSSALTITGDVTSNSSINFNGATTAISGNVTLTDGSIDFNGNATIGGSLTLGATATLLFQNRTLSIAGDYISSGGVLSANGNSTLTLTGATPLTSALQFSGGGNSLNSLTINKSNAGISVSINTPLTITTALTLTAGQLDITGSALTLNNLSTLTRSGSSSITTSSPAGGPWNLTYTGGSMTTGLEIPGSGVIRNLTANINNLATLTLDQPITVSGAFSLPNNGRTFTSGANAITISGSFTNGGTFNAPVNETLSVGGNFVQARTFNHNNGTLVITGSSVMSGSFINTTNFNNLTISGTGNLTAPATLNILGQFTNNGTFNAGTGRVIFNNAATVLAGTAINSTVFNNVTLSSGVAFTPPAVFTIRGNLLLNGTYNAAGNTLVCDGTCTLTGTNSTTTNFNHLTITPSGTITAPVTFTLTGNFTNNGGFNAGTGTLIFAGTSVISGSQIATTNFNHVTINGGATVTAPATFNLQRDFTNNGTFNTNNGTVVFLGTAAQLIGGTSVTRFNNISVTNSNSPVSVRVASNQELRGVLTLGEGSNFDADGTGGNILFTLLSVNDVAGSDASIATIPATASVIGNVRVQRYFDDLDARNRFISSPVTNASVAQLQDDIFVTGNFTGTSSPPGNPCTGCESNGANLKYNIESVPGSFQAGYTPTPVSGGTNAEVLVPGRGYDIFTWNGIDSTMLDLRGPINQGSISFNGVDYTNNGVPNSDGWNLIGNPYPSSIQWSDPADGAWEMTNIDPVVWVYDVAANLWRFYDYTNETGNLPNGIISTAQGFWVHALSENPSLTINETAKVGNSGAYYRKRSPAINGLHITLSDADVTDDAFIFLNEAGTRDFDKGLDSYKLEAGIERMSLSVLAGNSRLVKYVTSSNALSEAIAINIEGGEGKYTLKFAQQGGGNEFSDFYLFDAYRNTVQPISKPYSFEIGPNISSRHGRFFIARQAEIPETAEERDFISFYPNPVRSTLSIDINSESVKSIDLTDNLGRRIETVSVQSSQGRSEGQVEMKSLPSGLYFIKVITRDNNIVTRKVLKH